MDTKAQTQERAAYAVMGFLAWIAAASLAINRGKTLADWLAFVHPDNASNARNAYNVAKSRQARNG